MAFSNPRPAYIASPGGREITMSHIFNAPRELMYKVYTDPKLIPQWWGPKAFKTTVDKMDVKPGGSWRFVQRDFLGNKYAFRGVYHQAIPAELLIYTFEWEGMPNHVLLETVRFEDVKGKTRLNVTSVFQEVADRDAMLNSGMEKGAVETWIRLAALVEEE